MSEELPVELKVLGTRAQVIYSRVADLKVCDQASYKLAAEILVEIKRTVKDLEEKVNPVIAKAWDVHKVLMSAKKKALEGFADAEKLAKDKMANYYTEAEASSLPLPEAEGTIVSEIWTGRITDPAKIPRKFLTPDLDKLKAHTKAYKEAATLPGWEVFKTKQVSQRT